MTRSSIHRSLHTPPAASRTHRFIYLASSCSRPSAWSVGLQAGTSDLRHLSLSRFKHNFELVLKYDAHIKQVQCSIHADVKTWTCGYTHDVGRLQKWFMIRRRRCRVRAPRYVPPAACGRVTRSQRARNRSLVSTASWLKPHRTYRVGLARPLRHKKRVA